MPVNLNPSSGTDLELYSRYTLKALKECIKK